MRKAVDTHQDERRSQRIAERIDRLAQRRIQLFSGSVARGIRKGARSFFHQKRLEPKVIVLPGLHRSRALPRADLIELEVHRDPVKPGVRLASAVESRQRLVRPNECLLRDILRFRAITKHVSCQPKNARLVLANQLTEGGDIPFAGAVDELLVGRFWRRFRHKLRAPQSYAGFRRGLRNRPYFFYRGYRGHAAWTK